MNGKTLTLVVLTASIVLFVFFGFFGRKAIAFQSGPDPGLTGAPGESTCTACHGGGPSGGVLTIEGLPETYTSGQQIILTVRLNQTGRARFGFELTAIGGNGQSAGTIELIEPQRTQLKNSFFGPQRVYVEHTFTGTGPQNGEGLWTFRWTAPATSVGPVTFYAAGNSANGDSSTSGDSIYTATRAVGAQLVNETTTVRINPATIQRGQNGVVSIDLIARGGQEPENAVGFSLAFDPGQLSFVMAAPGTGAQGANFIVNSSAASSGQIGIIVARNPGTSFTAGTHQLAVLTFVARPGGSATSTPIGFTDAPVPRQVVDVNAQLLPANWLNGTIGIADSCVYSISPSVSNFSAKGVVGIVDVTAGANCDWNVANSIPWVSILGGTGGTGNGTVTFEVSANTGIKRAGSMIVAGQTFSVRQGANFLDVPEDSVFYEFIGKVSAAGITIGCNPNGTLFCPDQIVTRDQMAAFIIRALGEFNPPFPAQQRFGDVFPTSVFYSFIDQMAARQITVGCNPQGTNYCPGQAVTREQMAAFIIRALTEFNPAVPAQQRFLDVPPANTFFAFIDQMAVRKITVGCNPLGTIYCPTSVVTREQMAAFLVRAFGL